MLKTPTDTNALLASLSEADLSSIRDCLRPVRFEQGETVYVQGDRVEHLYFPLNCVFSTLAVMNDGATVEVSMTGRESAAGVSAAFGDYEARNWTRALIAGEAVKVSAEALKELCARSEAAHARVMSGYRRLISQVSQRAICNCRHTLLQRLCTWLLMVHDRAALDDLPLTQESIAGRLGARRAGVTQAARFLLRSRGIRYSRGKIQVAERAMIKEMACECYRVHEEDFRHAVEGEGKTTALLNNCSTRTVIELPDAWNGSTEWTRN